MNRNWAAHIGSALVIVGGFTASLRYEKQKPADKKKAVQEAVEEKRGSNDSSKKD
ncbi:hypothetical protein H2203_006751 [Taxawa tesnikishii (nom. ined.)]|nr:hypothetical protein H2203_006751 [Dothideales sp. JES 119]